MSYFAFLALFLGLPILLLALVLRGKQEAGRPVVRFLPDPSPYTVILLHVVIAVLYTTPWDNYLVATRVWWYDPELVTGITFGWVPIEEYTFFVLQPILTGLWLLFLARRLTAPAAPFQPRPDVRRRLLAGIGLVWAASLALLLSGWEPGTYLALQLVWALPPIALQIAYGADILWHYRRLVLFAILIPTIYLGAADAVAIQAGTWTISPTQSLGIEIAGRLPLEELLFFFLTNTLIAFGVSLSLVPESRQRLRQIQRALSQIVSRPTGQAEREQL
ncbi:MAG: lycopene cyclase domain-containing protein [Candidatus Promineifilaceae bacterium]|nr:lycopene cyclase domain-containing protein [Candidatus Promineifilaceae bacterium]